MSELYEKSLLKLELNQVLAQLSECAGSMGGKEACLRVRPSSDLEEVELRYDRVIYLTKEEAAVLAVKLLNLCKRG